MFRVSMIFKYRPILVSMPGTDSGLTLIHRPMAIVRIPWARKARKFEALVDTGTDECVFPVSVAQAAGIDLADATGAEISGVGGGLMNCLYAPVQLELTDGTESLRWMSRVGFVEYHPAEREMLILGHSGFLEYFTAIFDGEALTMELEPNSRLPVLSV